MIKTISPIILAIFILGCMPSTKEVPTENQEKKILKEATVYTTAYNSEFQLNKTGTKSFGSLVQPLETEISICKSGKKIPDIYGYWGSNYGCIC